MYTHTDMYFCIHVRIYIHTHMLTHTHTRLAYQRQFPARMALHQAHHALFIQFHDDAKLPVLERCPIHLAHIVTAHRCHEQDACLATEHGHLLLAPCRRVLFNCHGMLLPGLA